MNNMTKQLNGTNMKHLRALSLSVGQFIRYWGFRRVHGAIWTQLYLSPRPLSGTELAERLKLSKALVSPALAELEKWQLIQAVKSPNEKVKLYAAEEDVTEVIHKVLRMRERKIIDEVAKNLEAVQDTASAGELVSTERVEKLAEMVEAAQLMLTLMLDRDDLVGLPRSL